MPGQLLASSSQLHILQATAEGNQAHGRAAVIGNVRKPTANSRWDQGTSEAAALRRGCLSLHIYKSPETHFASCSLFTPSILPTCLPSLMHTRVGMQLTSWALHTVS